jgi:hypothetical protein
VEIALGAFSSEGGPKNPLTNHLVDVRHAVTQLLSPALLPVVSSKRQIDGDEKVQGALRDQFYEIICLIRCLEASRS